MIRNIDETTAMCSTDTEKVSVIVRKLLQVLHGEGADPATGIAALAEALTHSMVLGIRIGPTLEARTANLAAARKVVTIISQNLDMENLSQESHDEAMSALMDALVDQRGLEWHADTKERG